MPKINHIHKFKKLRYKSGNEVFFCILPDCSVKINPALALGKRSICHRCGNEFILNEYSLRLVKPHCESCHLPKNGIKEVINFDDAEFKTPDEHLNKPELSLEEQLRQTISEAEEEEL